MAVTYMQINIRVPTATYHRLSKAASARGYSTTGYAQLLFDAAFAARIGHERGDPVTDAELDEQVRLVFALAGQADVAAISKATGIKADLVERILTGWCAFGKGVVKITSNREKEKARDVEGR